MSTERIKRRIERLLDEADQAADGRTWEVVLDRAQQVLTFDPGNADAQAYLAAAQRAMEAPSAPVGRPEPAPSVPASFAGGRYEVKKFLGEGGKKKVYLAHDTLLDRDVAFALIKTEGLDEAAGTRIRREAQAMGRLGSHPHIVTVFDLGQQDSQPYMVTEFMAGGDVEALIEKAAEHRVPLEQCLDVIRQVCQGLEFAHSKGIVHRDLKPGNVWLTVDGRAKIGDFGLALPLDRSRLTQEGMMVGTVSYMPPEQAMGGEVTSRADLYSLGCMLYEMVTGRPPFLGDDPVAIIGQHINTRPVAPTWHCPQCPRLLEALIMRLLAKDPSQRPESAADVLSALDGIDLTVVAEQPEEEATSLDSLAGGVFVGRQREMGELKAALEDALSGRGRLITLVGEPGIGKTRTAFELTTYAGLRRAQVLWGRCYESQGMPPFWPWVQAIRSYVREHDAEQLRSEMGAGAADIAEIISEVRARLPDLEPAPALEDPEAARFRLFDSVATFLKGASQTQPLVLILDDLHWADKPSLLLLQFVAGELAGSRLLVIGAYRDVELSRRHPLAQTLGELTRERLFQRVLLRGLRQEDVGRFIELTARTRPPQGLVRAVHTQTEGNPLFVNEVVRLLVQEGELTPERLKERKSWTVRIPEGVREVIGRRLDRLSERCNQVLTVASVIGREFTLQQLAKLVEDLSQERLLEVLEQALAARVIEELPRAVGHYQFTHGLIQETLAEELSLTRRVRLHASIAQALEELYGEQAEAHAAELAYHFGQAEAVLGTEKLVKYSLLAGEKALSSYAYEEAMAHFQRGLAAKEGKPMDSETTDLLFGLGRAQASTLERHRLQEAVDSLRRAFDYYVKADNKTRAVAVARYPFPPMHGPTGLAQLVAQALKLMPSGAHEAGYLLARYGLYVSMETGDYAGANDAFERALSAAQRHGDANLELRTLADSLSVYLWHGRHQEGYEKSLRILELCQRIEDLEAEGLARFFASNYMVSVTGEVDAARQHASACLALARRSRTRSSIVSALLVNGLISRFQGDWAGGRRYVDEGLALDPYELRLLWNRGLLEYTAGEFEQGASYLERLLEVRRMRTSISYLDAVAAHLAATATAMTGTDEYGDVADVAGRSAASIQGAEPLVHIMGNWALALLAVHRCDPAAADRQYAVLGGYGQAFRDYHGYGSDRVFGLLARTAGKLDRAAAHFEEALAFCRKAGYRPELAWTCCDYADTLLQRDGSGDREKAMALLDEALSISRELGMRPLMERVLSRKKILKA